MIVMGHGFGAERRFRLPAFAERLCATGMAVLLFDYRGFGDSKSAPRGLVDPKRYLADFAAAAHHAASIGLSGWRATRDLGHVSSRWSCAGDGGAASVLRLSS